MRSPRDRAYAIFFSVALHRWFPLRSRLPRLPRLLSRPSPILPFGVFLFFVLTSPGLSNSSSSSRPRGLLFLRRFLLLRRAGGSLSLATSAVPLLSTSFCHFVQRPIRCSLLSASVSVRDASLFIAFNLPRCPKTLTILSFPFPLVLRFLVSITATLSSVSFPTSSSCGRPRSLAFAL